MISEDQDVLDKIGSVLAVLSMAMFAYTVTRNGVGRDAATVHDAGHDLNDDW